MALNKFMHPRNIYKDKKPDFRALSEKYPEFKRHSTRETNGKVTIDFKKREALQALSTVLLKEDFGLDVFIPSDRLIPTIPLRLNYIHWIEDLIQTTHNENINGIDIGTGASCIYPLLASKMNGWKFLASEIDVISVNAARKNIQQNGLEHLITVQKVEMNSGLKDVLEGRTNSLVKTYDFCMCNPPFFGSLEEASGQFHRDGRSEPHSTPTANTTESVTWGGEFCFVNRLIEDSLLLRETIRVYTSMVGKKLNLAALKDELRRHKVPSICSTEFCQGKTMRWGLAWSFDPSFKFPKSHYKEKKKKAKSAPAFCVPMEVAIEFKTFCIHVIELLKELKINFIEVKHNNWILILALIITENTWSHQRRKRRQMLRESARPRNGPGATTPLTPSSGINSGDPAEKPSSTRSSESLASEPSEIGSEQVVPESCDSSGPSIDGKQKSPVGSISNRAPVLCSSEKSKGDNGDSVVPEEVSTKATETSSRPESPDSEPSATTSGKRDSCSSENSRVDNDDSVVPEEASTATETSSWPISPNSEPSVLTSSKRDRDEDNDNDDSVSNGHCLKRIRVQSPEQTDFSKTPVPKAIGSKQASEALLRDSMTIVDLTMDSPSPSTDQQPLGLSDPQEATPCLFKCNLSLRRNTTYVLFELGSLDGENRELMQQLLQYFRNKLLP